MLNKVGYTVSKKVNLVKTLCLHGFLYHNMYGGKTERLLGPKKVTLVKTLCLIRLYWFNCVK